MYLCTQKLLGNMNTAQSSLFRYIREKKSGQNLVDGDAVFLELFTRALPPELDRPILSGAFFILFVVNGTIDLSANYQQHSVHRKSLVILTPRTIVTWRAASPNFRAYAIGFDPNFFDSLPPYSHFYNQWTAYVSEHASPVIELRDAPWKNLFQNLSMFPRIETSRLHRNGMLRYLTNFLLLQIADVLYENCTRPSGRIAHATELYQQFRKFLAVHYKHEHNIAFYADKLCISPTYLSRIVRQVTGRTVNHQIAHRLLIEARYLLYCTDWPIKQIAEELHFADQASFGKFFKEHMQLAPSAYRQKIGLEEPVPPRLS